MYNTLPTLALVLGGANSGKSSFAERLVAFSGKTKVYVATAQAFDTEMEAKIDAHKIARGADWTVIEAPHELKHSLAGATSDQMLLIDCATMWLTNRMLAEADLEAEAAELLQAVSASKASVVVVSNEVGLGIVPDTSLGRAFRTAQGRLNQQLAAQADLAIFIAAGLPLVLKGTLPEGFA
ncbi:MAG: bifunctional adenosylcobinamide kinase/adenosylcobinamide-phosphate guanylyltransferase [Pseudomonadota bacterium]